MKIFILSLVLISSLLNMESVWARYEQPGDYVGDPAEVGMNSQDLHEYDNQRDQKKLKKKEQEKNEKESLRKLQTKENEPEEAQHIKTVE